MHCSYSLNLIQLITRHAGPMEGFFPMSQHHQQRAGLGLELEGEIAAEHVMCSHFTQKKGSHFSGFTGRTVSAGVTLQWARSDPFWEETELTSVGYNCRQYTELLVFVFSSSSASWIAAFLFGLGMRGHGQGLVSLLFLKGEVRVRRGGCSNVLVAFVGTMKSTAGDVKPRLGSVEFIKTAKRVSGHRWFRQ